MGVHKFLDAVGAFAGRRSLATLTVMSWVGVGLVGLADWATGYELSFSIFYLIPISFAGWYGRAVTARLASYAAGAMWLAVELISHPYSHPGYAFWNATVRFAFFYIVSMLLVDLKRRYVGEREMARSDSLTGLLNWRGFCEKSEDEVRRMNRYGRPFSVAYIDLDNFKHVNDTQGHEAGDRLLRALAETLHTATRSTDIVARLGGDEFAVLFPETDGQAVRKAADKLHSALVGRVAALGPGVGVSVGVVTFDRPPDGLDRMVAAADAVMYEVKRHGKNAVRYVTATPHAQQHAARPGQA
jgi:diguanylate cyclase (GGDEF)-like protein